MILSLFLKKKMKKNNKEGIRFNGVDSITIKNTPDNVVVMNKN
jgi:hypothetical protein